MIREMKRDELLKSVREAEYLTQEERQLLQQKRLHELVDYAREHSDYFKTYYQDLPEDYTLNDLPMTSKKQLMPHFEDWVTDKRVSREALEVYFSDLNNIGMPLLEEFSVLTTSGTTGQPLWMVRDSFHGKVHGSMMAVRLMERLGIDPWLDSSRYKMASIIGTGGFHSAVSSFERMKNSSPCPEHFLLCSILDPIPEIVANLNAFEPALITGYPSVMAVLAKEKLEGRLTIEPKAIACSAEQLTEYAYKMMKDAFNCTIANSFCSTEGGEVAFNCTCSNMHLNDDWIIIEPVDSNNQPVTDQTMSAGVLVTNLADYLQPIIRYHVEDSIIIEDGQCPCGSKLPIVRLLGRNGENLSFDIDGGSRTIAPVMLDFLPTKTDGILQYQFVQKSPKLLEMRIVYANGSNKEEVDSQISHYVKQLFKDNQMDAVVFEIVDQPPVQSKGGKIKTVVIDF